MNTFVSCFSYDIREAFAGFGSFGTRELFGRFSFIRSV